MSVDKNEDKDEFAKDEAEVMSFFIQKIDLFFGKLHILAKLKLKFLLKLKTENS